jgi:hypothetical protein
MAGVSPSVKTFTPKQRRYLAYIHLYTRLHRRPPAEADIQRYFCVTPPSVHQMVLTLEHAGFIRRQPGVARSIEVSSSIRNSCPSYFTSDSTCHNHCDEVLGSIGFVLGVFLLIDLITR